MTLKKTLKELNLSVPAQDSPISNFLTASGTLHDGDLLLNQKGLRLTSDENDSLPSETKEIDLQFSLEDLETIKVIRKGSGGVVQLVRRKLFALKDLVRKSQWAGSLKDHEEHFGSSSIGDPSTSSSSRTSTSADLADDASSSSSSSGPPFQLCDLMAELPFKRGLSKYYHGKSQTFGSLANVRRLEDLAKKESCYSQRMKWCYGGNLNYQKFGPKPTIKKRSYLKRPLSPQLKC